MKKIIAYYQIVGGAAGIFVSVFALRDNDIFFIAIGLLLFVISIVAGLGLLREGGKVGSYFNLGLQLLQFTFFQYWTLIAVIISVSRGGKINFFFHYGANFLVEINEMPVIGLGVNLMPLVFLIYLIKMAD